MELDHLDRRIVGALQVDGRASWRRIAEVIDAPFSTVTRRGSAMLASGTVKVAAITSSSRTAIFEVTATPQRVDDVAKALAARSGSLFVYVVSAPTRIVVEELLIDGSLARAVLEEIPAIEGVTGVIAAPVLEYYRTLSEWMPAILSAQEVHSLNEDFGRRMPLTSAPESAIDRHLQALLERDGRSGVAEISAALGASASSVRRRLTNLIGTSIEVRAVVAPAFLGLPISAFVWIRVAPAAIGRVAQLLLDCPFVRYAAMIMGDYQLVVDVALGSLDDLRHFLTDLPWAEEVEAIRSSPVLAAYKRSGVVVVES